MLLKLQSMAYAPHCFATAPGEFHVFRWRGRKDLADVVRMEIGFDKHWAAVSRPRMGSLLLCLIGAAVRMPAALCFVLLAAPGSLAAYLARGREIACQRFTIDSK